MTTCRTGFVSCNIPCNNNQCCYGIFCFVLFCVLLFHVHRNFSFFRVLLFCYEKKSAPTKIQSTAYSIKISTTSYHTIVMLTFSLIFIHKTSFLSQASSSHSPSNPLSTLTLIGILIALVGFVFLMIVLIVYFIRNNKSKQSMFCN